jgi:DNA-binding NarL/FixJ family response regulator
MLTREGIIHLLEEVGVQVIAQVGDAERLVELVARERPDAVIVDIRMPPTHIDEGIVAAGRIRDAFPDVGVLVLSQYVESAWALRLISEHPEGVGYLLKERVGKVEEFVDAARRVADGQSAVDPEVVARMLGRRRKRPAIAALSPRELEVMAAMAEGKSNRGIAEALTISLTAVEKHVTRIFSKLGLDHGQTEHRRVHAVLTYLRET